LGVGLAFKEVAGLATVGTTTVSKLLTQLCHVTTYQAVLFGIGQRAVTLYEWEGNHGSSIALAVR